MPRKKISAEDERCDTAFCCPIDVTLSVIGGKWKLHIYSHLWRGVNRFGQLRRAIPRITQTMLTQQLRELEQDGIVTRTVYPEIPPRVEYSLTEFGRTLEGVVRQMGQWGQAYVERVTEHKEAFRATRGGTGAGSPASALVAEVLAECEAELAQGGEGHDGPDGQGAHARLAKHETPHGIPPLPPPPTSEPSSAAGA